MTSRPVVVLTGASRGIGAATAVALARSGADLALVARSEPDLQRAAREAEAAGATVVVVAADVASAGVPESIVLQAQDRFGRIDALVNNAALLDPIAPLGDVKSAELTRILDVAVVAPLALVRHALPLLRATEGRVLNISSSAAHLPIRGLGAYCVAKSALAMATRVLAAEEDRVTILSVQPGPVDTGMHVSLREKGYGIDDERRAYYRRLQTQGELVAPEVPAARFAWLALNAPAEWSGRDIGHDDPTVPVPFGQPSSGA